MEYRPVAWGCLSLSFTAGPILTGTSNKQTCMRATNLAAIHLTTWVLYKGTGPFCLQIAAAPGGNKLCHYGMHVASPMGLQANTLRWLCFCLHRSLPLPSGAIIGCFNRGKVMAVTPELPTSVYKTNGGYSQNRGKVMIVIPE